jgi:hypothetical protein
MSAHSAKRQPTAHWASSIPAPYATMPITTCIEAPDHSSNAPLVSTTKAKACCALSHQLKSGNCRCCTGNKARTVTLTMASAQLKKAIFLYGIDTFKCPL